MSLQKHFADLAAEYERDLAFNARMFELARHNGYSTRTFHSGTYRCWMVPEQLVPVIGYQAAVLP